MKKNLGRRVGVAIAVLGLSAQGPLGVACQNDRETSAEATWDESCGRCRR
jgi:hypothetical protein